MQAFAMLDHLASVEGMGPVGEIRLVPDPSTFAIAPYAPHTATVLVDMQTLDGQPYAADGRFFLKRMIDRAANDYDLSLVAAFEPEWSLAIKTGDQFTPIDDSGCFTSTGMNMAAPVIDDIVAALESQGMTVEQYYAELGWGQQELSIRHAPAHDGWKALAVPIRARRSTARPSSPAIRAPRRCHRSPGRPCSCRSR